MLFTNSGKANHTFDYAVGHKKPPTFQTSQQMLHSSTYKKHYWSIILFEKQNKIQKCSSERTLPFFIKNRINPGNTDYSTWDYTSIILDTPKCQRCMYTSAFNLKIYSDKRSQVKLSLSNYKNLRKW